MGVGRRPGVRREDSGRGGGGGGGRGRPRKDDDGHTLVQGRPRKTADELDAEMADYFTSEGDGGSGGGADNNVAPSGGMGDVGNEGAGAAAVDEDIDMVE